MHTPKFHHLWPLVSLLRFYRRKQRISTTTEACLSVWSTTTTLQTCSVYSTACDQVYPSGKMLLSTKVGSRTLKSFVHQHMTKCKYKYRIAFSTWRTLQKTEGGRAAKEEDQVYPILWRLTLCWN